MSNGSSLPPTPDSVPGEGGDKKNVNPKRFLPQCFLIDFYKKFEAFNKDVGYDNLCKVSGNPAYAMNRLLDRTDSFSINDLTPAELSCLVPRFRLSKIYQDGTEKEFVFDDYTNIESITRRTHNSNLRLDSRGRPSAVGFKSFSWDDQGSNPADTGLVFKAELKLVAADISSLFHSHGPDHPTFSELLQQGSDKPKADLNPEYELKKSIIRADVGWKISPSLSGDQVFKGNKEQRQLKRDAVNNSTISLFLMLSTHEMSLKEDGGIELTITYNAHVETVTGSPAMNILYIGKKELELEKKAKGWIPELEDKLAAAKEKLKILEDTRYLGLQAKHGWGDFRRDVKRKLGVHDTPEINQQEEIVRYFERQLKETTDENAARSADERYKIYAKLSDEIIRRRRLFSVNLTDKQIEMMRKLTEIYTDTNLTAAQIITRRARLVKGFSLLEGTVMSPPRSSYEGFTDVGASLRNVASKPVDTSLMSGNWKLGGQNREGWMKSLGEGIEADADKAKALTEKRINFVFLGDILDAAFKIVRQSQIDDGIKEDKQIKYIVGSVDVLDFETGKFVRLNLADVPICYEYFNSWFYKKVVTPQLKNWNVRAFMQSVVAELVVNALSPVCFGNAMSKHRVRPNTTFLDLPYAEGRPCLPAGATKSGNAYEVAIFSDLEQLPKIKLSKNWKKNTEFSHYLYMYAAGFTSLDLKGDYEEDRKKRGIFHMIIGSDRGILKTVAFKRVDQPLGPEVNYAKQVAGGPVANRLFSERYSVDLTLVGNTLFKPGMMFYLDTSTMGIGRAGDHNSLAAKMGLGGYFRVIKTDNTLDSNKFETRIEGILECHEKPDVQPQAGIPLTEAQMADAGKSDAERIAEESSKQEPDPNVDKFGNRLNPMTYDGVRMVSKK